jgi:hypothetical protein
MAFKGYIYFKITDTLYMMIPKKYFFLYFFLNIVIFSFGQDQKNWIVDISKARSSFGGIRLDKIELNDVYTVVHMSFYNQGIFMQHIEACNTFHILSDGRKVAKFVKAENIPTRYVDKTGFSCADEETAMKIKPGQFVRFRIYLTRIPEYLTHIDIIEYDGMQECEFDIFNLNISKKEPLTAPTYGATKPKAKENSSLSSLSKAPAKVEKNTPKPTPPTPSKNKPQAAKEEPSIASKAIKPPVKEKPKPIAEKPKETAEPAKPALKEAPQYVAPEKRDVRYIKEVKMIPKVVTLEIWDTDQEDGDKISIMLNNHWILKDYTVTKNVKKMEFTLQPGENTLVFHAVSLGAMPPNTANIKFWDGNDWQNIVMKTDMLNSQAIKLIKI